MITHPCPALWYMITHPCPALWIWLLIHVQHCGIWLLIHVQHCGIWLLIHVQHCGIWLLIHVQHCGIWLLIHVLDTCFQPAIYSLFRMHRPTIVANLYPPPPTHAGQGQGPNFYHHNSYVMEIPFCSDPNIKTWSLQTFAHDMTAMLSWHVQEFVTIYRTWN